MLVVLDFGFMGGSMGSVVGEKIALGLEAAARQDLPLVAVVTGGGARIQEGVLSLMQMAKTVTAANRFKEKGLPFVVVLANPSTGQAYASFANLADVILAEPGSLIGLSPLAGGQRVVSGALASGRSHCRSPPGAWPAGQRGRQRVPEVPISGPAQAAFRPKAGQGGVPAPFSQPSRLGPRP